jgi:hypothetical protein
LGKLRGWRNQAAPAPSSRAAKRKPVQSFDVIRSHDAEPGHGGVGAQHRQLLFDGHSLEQIGDALLRGKPWVLIWQKRMRRSLLRTRIPSQQDKRHCYGFDQFH